MNADELKKEAEEYAIDNYENCFYVDLPYANDRRAREEAYLAGAEPRERRIEELEAQIEKMKCCQNCKYYSWCPKDCSKNEPCEGYNKWELKEIKEK